jgi:hypothetical protein
MVITRRKALYALGAVILVVLFCIIYLGWVRTDMSDFGVCYKNGSRILQGETLYRISDGHLQFKYAPVSALIYAPLALLPYEAAKAIWYILELCLLFATFWISYKLLPSRLKGPVFVLGLSFLILLKFIGREIELGQVNILIIFILTAMLAAELKKHDTTAGILWAISLFFKPYALILLPYFILRKRLKLIAVGSFILILGLALPIAYFGFQGNIIVLKEWISTLSKSTPGLLAVGDNASLYALIWKTLPGHHETLIQIIWIICGLIAAGALLWMMRRARLQVSHAPEVLDVAFLFVLIPLFSPLGWYYNYLYSTLAVVLLMNNLSKFPGVWKIVLIADVIMIGATLRETLGKTLFQFYNHSHLVAVNFIIVLIFLVYARARKIA